MMATNSRLKAVQILVTGNADAALAFQNPKSCKRAQTLLAQTGKTASPAAVASN
ncbi:hypothetical protein [Verrucomicrobium spinosum]|nr:hypothetical protein [Verrucomicrobium spinosum]